MLLLRLGCLFTAVASTMLNMTCVQSSVVTHLKMMPIEKTTLSKCCTGFTQSPPKFVQSSRVLTRSCSEAGQSRVPGMRLMSQWKNLPLKKFTLMMPSA